MNAISKILNEKLNYGGIMTPRHEIMKDMKDKGHADKDIDFYLFCLDQKKDKEQS